LLSANSVILGEPIFLAVIAAMLIPALVGIALARHCSSGPRPGLSSSRRRTQDTVNDSGPAGGRRLIVEEWRDGDLVTIGTVIVDCAARTIEHDIAPASDGRRRPRPS
jgi:hypothetical protein